MITYVLAANSELNEDDYNKKQTMNDSAILDRLGNTATANDVKRFEEIWAARFMDSPPVQGFPEGYPVFYDKADFDATWAEIQAII